ncbi:MAG: hypothetical protein ACLUB2_07195, partial [Butyricicoccus pullicaecorum]
MIPGYETVDHDKIERMLAARLESLGIPAEALDAPVSDSSTPPPSPEGVTLHQLVCDLIADILTEATDAAQRDLYNRQRAGRIAAQKQGVNLGRPSKKCSDKRFSKIRDLYESHQISA